MALTPSPLTALALVAALAAAASSSPQDPPPEVGGAKRSARALLVGCEEYPYLSRAGQAPGSNTIDLRGPSNDVDLFARTLQEVFGIPPDRMTRLCGWPDDERARPTKANIVRAFRALAEEAEPGQWIVVYLAGHGSQQPSRGKSLEDEPDGLDEIFLPADVRPSPDGAAVPNALSDDEIADFVRRIRAKGAEVWLVVDSCHSGTMLRGGGWTVRELPPDRLGLRGTAPRGSGSRAERAPATFPSGDGIVAFYGAQSFGSAPELPLPAGAEDARPHGLYTYLLAKELHRLGRTASYGELSASVVAAYQAFPCNLTVPLAEGDLALTVGGGARAASPPLLLVTGPGTPRLDQGRLAGIEPGVLVDVSPPDDPSGRPIARAEVVRSGLYAAEVEIRSGALPEEPTTCRATPVSCGLSEFRLAVAVVDEDDRALRFDALPEPARAALLAAASRFPVCADPAQADWRIVVGTHGLALRASGPIGAPDLLDIDPVRLVPTLERLLKVHNLRRLCGLFPGSGEGLSIRVERRQREGEAGSPVRAGDRLLPGDEIRVLLDKSGDGIDDVTVLYLDANWDVHALFPAQGRSARLEREAQAAFDLTGWVPVTDDALGVESVWVLAVPRGASDPEINLSWLAQSTVLTRGALEKDAASRVFAELIRGGAMRGLGARTESPAEGTLFQVPLSTAWGEVGPPGWGRGGPKELDAPLACLTDLPEAVRPGSRWQIVDSPARGAHGDVLLLGDETSPRAVLVDLRKGAAAAEPAAFRAQAAFLFPEHDARLALYARRDDGRFVLALADADGDGTAERRWTRGDSGWILEDRVAVPWLSQSYVGPVPDKARATACLRVLARD